MAIVEGPVTGGLIDRVKNILVTPKSEWDRIDGETATVQGLYVGYACILAAIGPIASLIGTQVFGWGGFGVHIRPPLIASLVSACWGYVGSLLGVFILAEIINRLAPSFGGTSDRMQAFKVAVYSSTAAWLAGVFGLIPMLSWLAIVGLYSLYLLYLGLPKLMKAPEDKAVSYTVVTVVVAIVIWIVIGAIAGAIAGAAMFGGGLASTPAAVVSVGGTRVDVGKLDATAAQLQAQAKQIQDAAEGKTTMPAAPIDALKALLPSNLPGGYVRNQLTGESGGVGGLQSSSAEGTYTKGEATITLKVTDAAAAGALASLGGAVGVSSEHQTATGYEKVRMENGRMISEKWDGSDKTGEYLVMVSSRFIVEADGSGASMADLKAAAATVSPQQLASLAK